MSAQPPAPASPPRSFRGWLFGTWLAKNKAWVKGILVALFAWVTAMLVDVKPAELNAVLVAAVGLLSKLGLDAVDYWLTEGPA